MRLLLPPARARGSASVEWMMGVALAVGLIRLATAFLASAPGAGDGHVEPAATDGAQSAAMTRRARPELRDLVDDHMSRLTTPERAACFGAQGLARVQEVIVKLADDVQDEALVPLLDEGIALLGMGRSLLEGDPEGLERYGVYAGFLDLAERIRVSLTSSSGTPPG